MRHKTGILWVMAVANALGVLMHGFLGNWAVMGISAVTALKSLAFIWTTKKGGKIPYWLSLAIFLNFTILAVFAVILTNVILTNPNANWSDWVVLGAQCFANWTQWAKSGHWIRFSSGSFSVLATVNNIMFMNVMGLVISGIKLFSISIFYIRLHRETKNKKPISLSDEPLPYPFICQACPFNRDCENCPYRIDINDINKLTVNAS